MARVYAEDAAKLVRRRAYIDAYWDAKAEIQRLTEIGAPAEEIVKAASRLAARNRRTQKRR